MSFRKYAEYKESGIEWLGEIPVGWTTQKLKFVARVQPSNVDKKSKKGEKEVLLCNYTDVYYNEEITADLSLMKATASDVQIKKFTLQSGDTIITKDSEDPNDIAVPAYVPQDLEGVVCGYHLALLRPEKGTCGRYLKRVMDTQYARSIFATRANGITRYGLGTYAISNFILPFPSLKEQKQIAAFLDKETTETDTLIDKQEQLITLLREKRQAIISHAVTKGLNPNAKMKDSGIEWLGEVPKHWDVRRLKYICRFAYGDSLPSEMRIEGDVPVYGSNGHVGFHSFSNTTAPCIVIGRKGSFGKVNYSPDSSFAIDTTFFVDSKYTTANIRWLYYLLGLLQLDAISKDAIVPGLNREDAYQQMGLFPPLKEQKQIAAYLDKETTGIDTLIEKCETAIALLKERRTALISAAVTGKIDVRGIVP